MAVKVRRGTRKYRSNESKFSKDPGTSLKSYRTQRKFTIAVAVVLGTGFGEELLQHWIISENTSFNNRNEARELQLLRLRGRRTETYFNANR